MPNLLGGIVLGYIWQLIINGVLSFFENNDHCGCIIWILGNGDCYELADDWLYDDHLYAAIQNISDDVKEALLYGVPVGNGHKHYSAADYACNYNLSVYDNDKCFKMCDLNLALTAGLPENQPLWLRWIFIIHSTAGWDTKELVRQKQ